MTAQACIKPEQVAAMPDLETAYERHMAIVRATLNQEVSKAGRTWNDSTFRQRYQFLQLATGDMFSREEIERVFTLDWVDVPVIYQRAYTQIMERFVDYVVQHGWAK